MAAQVWQDQAVRADTTPRADQAAGRRRRAGVDRPGRRARAARARRRRRVRAAGRRRAGAPGRPVHVPRGHHRRGPRAHGRAVEAARAPRRLGAGGPRPGPWCQPVVPPEPDGGRGPDGRRAGLVHGPVRRRARGGAADLGERAGARRDPRDPAGAGERPARARGPGASRTSRTGPPTRLLAAAATWCTCRSAPSGSSPRSWSGTATPSSCSPRRACAQSVLHLLRTRRDPRPGGGLPMAERASDRLLRMLGMITYLDRHEGVPVEAIAEQFGVSTRQVMDDIDTLWVTGTPGLLPARPHRLRRRLLRAGRRPAHGVARDDPAAAPRCPGGGRARRRPARRRGGARRRDGPRARRGAALRAGQADGRDR